MAQLWERKSIILYLRPLNDRAKTVVASPANSHFAASYNRRSVLAVGHIRSRAGGNTLATLGRSGADIYVEGTEISPIQCSFEIDGLTNVVMLYDRSIDQNTHVSGTKCQPFEQERYPRRVVVQRDLNDEIWAGTSRDGVVHFKIEWPDQVLQGIQEISGQHAAQNDEFRVDSCQNPPRFNISVRQQKVFRWVKKGPAVGAGQFGTVYSAVDVDSGKVMAVKVLRPAVGAAVDEILKWRSTIFVSARREVEFLAEIQHPHIIDFIGTQGWGGPQIEIFMSLAKGNLASLVRADPMKSGNIAEALFPQMLGALDYLANKGLIHRDIKPENILYKAAPPQDDHFHFQIGDFGVSNYVNKAVSNAGTPHYKAPEVYFLRPQTDKVDIWSLCVTILWTLDQGGLRRQFEGDLKTYDEILNVIDTAASQARVSAIREMSNHYPTNRPSAAQMLVRHYRGYGLTTPRHLVKSMRKETARSDRSSGSRMDVEEDMLGGL